METPNIMEFFLELRNGVNYQASTGISVRIGEYDRTIESGELFKQSINMIGGIQMLQRDWMKSYEYRGLI